MRIKLCILSGKIKFIDLVVNDEISLKGKPRGDVIEEIQRHEIHRVCEDAHGFDYLFGMSISVFTQEKIQLLRDEEEALQSKCAEIEAKTASEMWLQDLEELESAYFAYEARVKQRHFEEDVGPNAAASQPPLKRGAKKRGTASASAPTKKRNRE